MVGAPAHRAGQPRHKAGATLLPAICAPHHAPLAYRGAMQSDSQFPEPAQPDAAAPPSSPLFSSRKFAWAVAVLLFAAIAVAAVWAVRTWQTNRAIANVESSLATAPLPGRQGTLPAALPGGVGVAPQAAVEEGGGVAPPLASSSDRLPPLILPGMPVPAAVLRDLPEWVAAEVAPVQTSGASGDESAAPVATQPAPAALPRRRTDVAARGERKDRYGTVFARCPGPGESGAVECRRAVCSGAARKAAACAPYLN
jgi:hypothetical protein